MTTDKTYPVVDDKRFCQFWQLALGPQSMTKPGFVSFGSWLWSPKH
jgi:hypothetical protein